MNALSNAQLMLARARASSLLPLTRVRSVFVTSRARGFIPGDHRQWKRGLGNPRRSVPRNFWKLRLSTLAWGFGVSLLFTGSLVTSVAMWTVVVAGNTVLMWRYAR